MSATRRLLLVASLVLLSALPRHVHATWSIVVLDRGQRWIGVAAASCTPDVYGIMSLRPGHGVLLAQAIGSEGAIQRANELLADSTLAAQRVLQAVTSPPVDADSRFRQYAIATFAGGLAQFTGDSVAPGSHQRFSSDVLVQGNSLASRAVVDRAMDAIEAARAAGKPLPDVLMAGLAAGSAAGGDARCGSQRATSAFLVVARPGEKPFLPYLTLSVFGARRGTVNAVEVLAGRLERWTSSGGPLNPITSEGVQPAGR